jgi:hypothetical protein
VTERLGYEITSFTAASPTATGVIKAQRDAALGKEGVTVKITCGAGGVKVDASANNPILAAGDFRRAFYSLFQGMTEVALRGESKPQRGQLRVTITPVRGLATKLEFGREVTDVLPVRVEVSNATDRTYVLDAGRIMLVTTSGQRVAPLTEAAAQSLPRRPLAGGVLQAGARAQGYLYYPPGGYTGARGYVTEQESGEREGFSVRF